MNGVDIYTGLENSIECNESKRTTSFYVAICSFLNLGMSYGYVLYLWSLKKLIQAGTKLTTVPVTQIVVNMLLCY